MRSILNQIQSRLWLRLTLILLLTSLLPLTGAGWLTLTQIESSVQRNAARRHETLATVGAGLVRELIGRGQEKLVTMSRLLADELPKSAVHTLDKSNRAQIVDRLNRLVEPPDVFLELQFYAADEATPQGQVARFIGQASQVEFEQTQIATPDFAEQRRQQIDANLLDPLVRTPLASNKIFLSPEPREIFGFPSLPISSPVRAAKQRPVGVLVSYLDLRKLGEQLEPLALGGFRVRLLSAKGASIAQVGTATGESTGTRKPVGHGDWTIEVMEPVRIIEESLNDAREQVLLWLGLAVLLAVAISFGLSAWIGRPVSALTRTARRMEAGDLGARSGITGPDELGRLGAAFDSMAAALESLDEAKSDFIANVSHELRSPLTSMRLSVANLTDGVLGPVETKQQRALERIRVDIDRLIAMVNDLLEMARLQAGAAEPQRLPVDLHAVAEECVGSFAGLAGTKGIELRVSGSGRATTDPAMLARIVSNLIDNAVKFGPEGSVVDVHVRDGQVRVTDQGPGFDSLAMFERFRQGESAGVKNSGAGLGLAIVKRIVELLGGQVELQQDQGTTIVVGLPAAADA